MKDESDLEKENEILRDRIHQYQEEISHLTQVKHQLEEVITNVPVILYTLDKNGIFTLSEGAGLEDLGLKPGQVVGASVFDVYSEYPEIIEAHKKSLSGLEATYSVKVIGNQKIDNVQFKEDSFYEAITKPTYTKEGRADGVIGIAYNVTHIRKAEKKISENETRYRTLINEAPIGVLVIQQGFCKFANPFFLSIFGFRNLEDIYDRPSAEFLSPEVRDNLTERALRREKGENEIPNYETKCIKKDGTLFPAHVEARRIIYNEKPSVMLFFRDITEIKKLSEEKNKLVEQLQLSHKLESLGIVAGGVAHDFNNLLVGIMGYASLILNNNVSDKVTTEYAQEIQNIAKEATILTKQMLTYTGKSVLNLVVTTLNDIINEVRKLISLTVQKSISLNYKLSTTYNDRILADSNQIKQVILNLAINASEAIGNNTGTIVIATGSEVITEIDKNKKHPVFNLQPGKYSFVEISDNGSGIVENEIKNIFDPFYSTKFTGRGLGLSVVQGIVMAHNGSIEVDSIIGKGTKFKIFFPVTDKVRDRPKVEIKPMENIKTTGTVLFCDDDVNIRTVGEKMLEKIGFSTFLASNGIEALKIFEEKKKEIMLVILDLTMPEMTGKDVLLELRKLSPSIPIIMSSGYNKVDVAEVFENTPQITFLQKPYSLTSLKEAINTVLQ